MENKWSLFKLRVNIRQPLDKVYAAWATPGGLESWFLRRAEIALGPPGIHRLPAESMEAGDHYAWYWHGYPDTAVEKGRIIAANGVDHFAFTFSLGCPVSVSLYGELDETIVELVESELPTDEDTMLRHYVGDSKGWIFYLTNLKSVLEGGWTCVIARRS